MEQSIIVNKPDKPDKIKDNIEIKEEEAFYYIYPNGCPYFVEFPSYTVFYNFILSNCKNKIPYIGQTTIKINHKMKDQRGNYNFKRVWSNGFEIIGNDGFKDIWSNGFKSWYSILKYLNSNAEFQIADLSYEITYAILELNKVLKLPCPKDLCISIKLDDKPKILDVISWQDTIEYLDYYYGKLDKKYIFKDLQDRPLNE